MRDSQGRELIKNFKWWVRADILQFMALSESNPNEAARRMGQMSLRDRLDFTDELTAIKVSPRRKMIYQCEYLATYHDIEQAWAQYNDLLPAALEALSPHSPGRQNVRIAGKGGLTACKMDLGPQVAPNKRLAYINWFFFSEGAPYRPDEIYHIAGIN